MSQYLIRSPFASDIPFIVETIIAAEKSGTDKLGLATIFGLKELKIKQYLSNILEEQSSGCELSLNSFLIATHNSECVAAAAAWVEGRNEDCMPSAMLKANLFAFCLPKECLLAARNNSDIIKGIQIERQQESLQVEYVYVKQSHRGHGLSNRLILEHASAQSRYKNIQIQVFANNYPAIASYKRIGFTEKRIYKSELALTAQFMPCNEKILMEKEVL
jgi:ribosomal protein S18 acetylase RimI-like enzyme